MWQGSDCTSSGHDTGEMPFFFFMIRVERGRAELMIGLLCICHFFPQTHSSNEFSGDIWHCFLLIEVTFFHSCFIVFMHLLWNQSAVAIIYHTILESAEMYIYNACVLDIIFATLYPKPRLCMFQIVQQHLTTIASSDASHSQD